MTSARLRFGLFVATVLALPAALMAIADPQLRDLGKLTMIVSPGIAGFALAPQYLRSASTVSWRWVFGAAAITLLVALGALVVAAAMGAASFELQLPALGVIAGAAGWPLSVSGGGASADDPGVHRVLRHLSRASHAAQLGCSCCAACPRGRIPCAPLTSDQCTRSISYC